MKFMHTETSCSVRVHLWGADIHVYSSGNAPRTTCVAIYRYIAGHPWDLVGIRTYRSSP